MDVVYVQTAYVKIVDNVETAGTKLSLVDLGLKNKSV